MGENISKSSKLFEVNIIFVTNLPEEFLYVHFEFLFGLKLVISLTSIRSNLGEKTLDSVIFLNIQKKSTLFFFNFE